MFQEIDSLRTFLIVCETKSIRKGAEKLNLTQPAVSRRIQKIEEELNVQLFDRKSHGIELTDFGRTLYSCAEKINSLCNDTLLSIQEQASGKIGELRIGAGHAWCNAILPNAILKMTEYFPETKITLISGLNGTTMKLLENEDLDVVIGTLEPDYGTPSEYSFEFLKTVNMHIYSSDSHNLFNKENISISDLSKQKWITFTGSSIGLYHINHYFNNAKIEPPKSIIETNSLQAAIKLVESGDFIMMLPDLLKKTLDTKNIQPLKLREKLWDFSAGLTYRNNGLKNEAISFLKSTLLELLDNGNNVYFITE